MWPSLAVAGVVLLGFFLFHLFATPHRLATEAEAATRATLKTEQAAHVKTRDALANERKSHQLTREEMGILQSAFDTKPLDGAHVQRLTRIALQVRGSIQANKRIGYADTAAEGDVTHSMFRSMFLAHCPQVLIDALNQWDLQVGYEALAQDDLRRVIDKHMAERGITEPIFHEDNVRTMVYNATSARSLQGYLDGYMQFPWVGFGDEIYLSVGTSPPILSYKEAGERPGLQIRQFKFMYSEVQRTPEAKAIRDRFAARVETGERAMAELNLMLNTNFVNRCDWCP